MTRWERAQWFDRLLELRERARTTNPADRADTTQPLTVTQIPDDPFTQPPPQARFIFDHPLWKGRL